MMLKGENRIGCIPTIPKEDFTEVTSKDQESESIEAYSNPLISFLSPSLKAVCSKLLSKYPEIVGDTDKWTLSTRSFMFGQIGLSYPNCNLKVKRTI